MSDEFEQNKKQLQIRANELEISKNLTENTQKQLQITTDKFEQNKTQLDDVQTTPKYNWQFQAK